jgi:hypothetical protein
MQIVESDTTPFELTKECGCRAYEIYLDIEPIPKPGLSYINKNFKTVIMLESSIDNSRFREVILSFGISS